MKNRIILSTYILAVIMVLVSTADIYGFTNFSQRFALFYNSIFSGMLLILISVIAYLSMNTTSEPYYKKMAFTDMLTGHENRMAFEHRLRACGPLADHGESVTLIVFDLNTLKKINDTHGHKAGDTYLKNTADFIFENLEGRAPLYRIGGDEFASIIVGINETELEVILQNMRTEKRKVYRNYRFSCAFGAATFIVGMDKSLRDVFKRADEAMYVEKIRTKMHPYRGTGTVNFICS